MFHVPTINLYLIIIKKKIKMLKERMVFFVQTLHFFNLKKKKKCIIGI